MSIRKRVWFFQDKCSARSTLKYGLLWDKLGCVIVRVLVHVAYSELGHQGSVIGYNLFFFPSHIFLPIAWNKALSQNLLNFSFSFSPNSVNTCTFFEKMFQNFIYICLTQDEFGGKSRKGGFKYILNT